MPAFPALSIPVLPTAPEESTTVRTTKRTAMRLQVLKRSHGYASTEAALAALLDAAGV